MDYLAGRKDRTVDKAESICDNGGDDSRRDHDRVDLGGGTYPDGIIWQQAHWLKHRPAGEKNYTCARKYISRESMKAQRRGAAPQEV